MQIRPALPGELSAVGDLRVAAYRADGFLTAESTYAPILRALGTDGAGEVLAAVDGAILLGTVMLQPWPYAEEVVRAPHEAEIRALAVAPHARGRGIGAALVAAVTQRARALGVRELLLLTRPDMLAAQRLYSMAGFRRLPDRDWSPRPDLLLLAYGKGLAPPAGT